MANRLVAVLDNDDVILRMGDKKLAYMRDYFPNQEVIRDIRPYECSRTALVPIIGMEFYNRMNAIVKGRESTLSMPPFDGAVEGIKALSDLYELHALSARTPQETDHVKERLGTLGIEKYFKSISSTEDPKYDGIEHVSGVKKVDASLYLGASAFTDDDERHMPNGIIRGLHCYLFGEGERNIGAHIVVVRNWQELVARHRELATPLTRFNDIES